MAKHRIPVALCNLRTVAYTKLELGLLTVLPEQLWYVNIKKVTELFFLFFNNEFHGQLDIDI